MAKKTSGKRAGKATASPKAKAKGASKGKATGKAIRRPDGRIAKKVAKKVGERVDGRYARKVVKTVGDRVDGRYARKVVASVSRKGKGRAVAKGPSRPRTKKAGKPQRYEIIGTTADVAIKALGRTHDALFTNAALGLADLMCDTGTVQGKVQREVVSQADSPERLMVTFLTELLVLHESEGLVFSSIEARVRSPEQTESKWRLLAVVMGEPFEKGRHQMLHDVKAVTYHTLEVSPERGYARVLFDV
jgi:SHS2 domain-containing protein